jgi:uncharacterized protein YbjT (DUF2867 family)
LKIKSAFIAGATGYTGREVVRLLAQGESEVFAHIRPDSASLSSWTERFGAWGASVDTTPWETEAMADALRQHRPDVVFCLIGTTRARGRRSSDPSRETYDTVDFGLSALLVDACEAAGHAPRIVYVSSVGCGPTTSSAYMHARWKTEEYIRGSSLPYVIARPSFISGPDRDEGRPMERLGSAFADGILTGLGALGGSRIARRYRSTDGATLAQALIRLAASDDEHQVVESEDLR